MSAKVTGLAQKLKVGPRYSPQVSICSLKLAQLLGQATSTLRLCFISTVSVLDGAAGAVLDEHGPPQPRAVAPLSANLRRHALRHVLYGHGCGCARADRGGRIMTPPAAARPLVGFGEDQDGGDPWEADDRKVGLGRIVAVCCRSSTSNQMH